ncbi:MAG TPA: cytosine permease [Frankiaceae bacterium]|jgi:putative hydroxymethylpyrimidine transporter CytX|nr:cytosine permease [Frankiaceae bacterium]
MGASTITDPRVEPGRREPAAEAGLTLHDSAPKALGLADQLGLWGSLGITLTLPIAAAFLPKMSLLATLVAVVVGSIAGSLLLGLAARAGAETGAPAMVLMRGLFGLRGSYLPTALNIAQCIGWTTVEVLVIAQFGSALTTHSLRWVFLVGAGIVATLLALRPLGFVRLLRKYAVWLALAATLYLFIQVLRRPLPSFTHGGWSGFGTAVDLVIALPVSWIPLAADYSRHSKTPRAAFVGSFAGFATTCTIYFSLGVLALAAALPGSDPASALLAVPVAGIAVLVLVLDEVKEAFANLYSTAISAQNLIPGLDRRIVAGVVGAGATAVGLLIDLTQYESYLYLIGSVFVPLFGVFAVNYYVLQRGLWDVSTSARGRWVMTLPWLAGFVSYQLVNPGAVSWWKGLWPAWTAPSWLSATLVSLLVSAAGAFVIGAFSRRWGAGRRRSDAVPAAAH